MVLDKFQKIHSDLIIEGNNKQFVSQIEKDKIQSALQSSNNLSDIEDKALAVTNLGLDGLKLEIINDRIPIIGGSVTLTRIPLDNKIIFNICYVITPTNEIIAEEYDGLTIQGTQGVFKENDVSYEGMDCLLSYASYAL